MMWHEQVGMSWHNTNSIQASKARGGSSTATLATFAMLATLAGGVKNKSPSLDCPLGIRQSVFDLDCLLVLYILVLVQYIICHLVIRKSIWNWINLMALDNTSE